MTGKMGKACYMYWVKINAFMVLVGKPEGTGSLGRYRHRYKCNIMKTDYLEMGWNDMEWIDQAPDRVQWRALVITVMNLDVV
jgi:hypothetical protein